MATLGGVTLTNLDKCDVSEVFVGQQTRSANGLRLTDYANILLKWSLQCSLLTEAQRDAIKAVADATSTQTFVDVDGNSYTVSVTRGSYTDTRVPNSNGEAWYALAFDIEEHS